MDAFIKPPPESFTEYKPYFFKQRRSFHAANSLRLEEYKNKWIETAVKKLNKSSINSFIKQITRETIKSRDNLIELMMDVERRVGANPLLYATDVTTFEKTKVYLTNLFELVREKK